MSLSASLSWGSLGLAAEPPVPEPAVGAEAASSTPAADLGLQAYFLGRWPAAIDLLRSVPIELRTPLHWLHLARAQAREGQLVEAWDSYTQLEELHAPGAEGLEANREMAVLEGAQVRERIPWAEISVSAEAPPGAAVYVDHELVAPERLGVPYPVNPGLHTFFVEYRGEIWAARRLRFEEGQQLPVLLVRMPDDPLELSSARRGRVEPAQERSSGQAGTLWVASYVSLGIGAAGTLAGAGLAMSDSELTRTLGAASFGVGGLGLLGGGALALMARDRDVTAERAAAARAERAALRPVFGFTSVGVAGSF